MRAGRRFSPYDLAHIRDTAWPAPALIHMSYISCIWPPKAPAYLVEAAAKVDQAIARGDSHRNRPNALHLDLQYFEGWLVCNAAWPRLAKLPAEPIWESELQP